MYRESLDTKYIRDILEAEDIEKVWQLLRNRFHFNIEGWKKAFETEVLRSGRFVSREEAFMIFGKKEIEPLLNVVLKRNLYPTWIRLLCYVLKDKLDEKMKRDDYYKNRYGKKID
ncbi:MAG: hypothetical protein ABIS36_24490 [Chryseolinea sp.]